MCSELPNCSGNASAHSGTASSFPMDVVGARDSMGSVDCLLFLRSREFRARPRTEIWTGGPAI
eukprot:12908881-Alexandrium_andersonii.AAC.1